MFPEQETNVFDCSLLNITEYQVFFLWIMWTSCNGEKLYIFFKLPQNANAFVIIPLFFLEFHEK